MKIYNYSNIPNNATLIVKNGVRELKVSLRVPKVLKSHLGVYKTSKGNYVISETIRVSEYDYIHTLYITLVRKLQYKAREMKIRHLRDEQFLLKQGRQLKMEIL